jgi:Fe-S-cluster containining protein
VVERYCIVYVGESSRFPLVLLKDVGRDEACPFLLDNRCSIHRHKPTVCALFPLGRAMMYDRKTDEGNNAGNKQERKLFYFLQDTHCGTKDESHTVKEWLGEFDLADSEAWFFEWSDALGRLSVEIHALEELVPEGIMQMVFNTIFNEIYLNYYGGMDFMQQFRTNTEKVETLLRGLNEKIRNMKGSDKA